MLQNPILFIHGFGGSKKEFEPIKKYLQEYGFNNFYDFCYDKKIGQVSLSEIGDDLIEFVRINVKENKVDIIGVSQGGLLARYFIVGSKIKVSKCITLCTPHKGSKSANIWNLPGLVDLRPNSKFLIELLTKEDKSKSISKFYCVYNPFDLMVFPGSNAKFSKAEKNLKVSTPLHQLSFSHKKALEFIVNSLKEK